MRSKPNCTRTQLNDAIVGSEALVEKTIQIHKTEVELYLSKMIIDMEHPMTKGLLSKFNIQEPFHKFKSRYYYYYTTYVYRINFAT